ncbi:MAG: DUF4188 domain-containing protein, partial [Actinomycetospora chiangmaiensis]|nr:DUF4188 domain-containing protein [Actinomycetospora chiangmaiensis]
MQATQPSSRQSIRHATRQAAPARRSVDLSAYPDLVVVYLGFRVTRWRGLLALMGLGRGIAASVQSRPDGLLAHENLFFGLTHVGLRQYWRDLESLEHFTRSEPHRTWWRDFSRDSRGSGFWHEAYTRGGV